VIHEEMTSWREGLQPHPGLLTAWLGSGTALLAWQYLSLGVGAVDMGVSLAAYTVCLPLVDRRLNPRLLPPLGCAFMGLAIGLLLIDLCFDVLILSDVSVRVEDQVISGRKVAWLYYHTMLNKAHVNFALAVFMVLSFLGAMVGLGQSDSRGRSYWQWLVISSIVGNSSYLMVVVPRYLSLRHNTVFSESDFDDWGRVVAARAALLIALGTDVALCISLTLQPEKELRSAVLCSAYSSPARSRRQSPRRNDRAK